MTWLDEHRLKCDLEGCVHVSPAREVEERNYLPKPWVQHVVETHGRADNRVLHFCHRVHKERWEAAQAAPAQAVPS